MGILDDAIREHLDLKRRRGADDSELRRLEDEAFGPPTRPGEPDFPDGNGEPASDIDAEALTQVQEPTVTALAEAEEAVEEHAVVGPEADDEAEEPAAEAPVADEPAAESALYDAELDLGDLDLNLDQELGDQDFWDDEDSAEPAAEVAEEGEEPVADSEGDPMDRAAEPPEPVEAAEPPPTGLRVEQLDTVEHEIQIEEEEAGAGEAPVGDPPLDEAIAAGLEDDEELLVDDDMGGDDDSLEDLVDDESDDVNVVLGDLDDEESDEDVEDVLEETPEFLRDDPEDDELWFEQGEPKDFDFEE